MQHIKPHIFLDYIPSENIVNEKIIKLLHFVNIYNKIQYR